MALPLQSSAGPEDGLSDSEAHQVLSRGQGRWRVSPGSTHPKRGHFATTFSLSNASAFAWASLAMSAGGSARRSRNARPFAFGA